MLSNADYKYFQKARKIASISDYAGTMVGCVAVYQGHIIGIGCNTEKTHPTQKYYNRFREPEDSSGRNFTPKLHAEINCLNSIKHMDIKFSKVKLYVYRIRFGQSYGIARPCPSCMAMIRDLGIKHIYYTTNNGFAYENVTEGSAA